MSGLESVRGDFRAQAEFVADAAWRLLALQDDNPASPTYGCFHCAYWRDKTSEFPDARFQEAGATLGLLALPFFDAARAEGRLPPAAALMRGFSAGLGQLARAQYAGGSYDEWYKGERGYAATAFTTIAYGLAARFLGDRMPADDRARLGRTCDRAGGWLVKRWDRVKTNHEAAGAAALALASDVTGDSRFGAAARAKLDDVLRRQQPEGWFPEIGGMDLGYCSVLLDYVMLFTLVTDDDRGVPAMRKLMAFMLPLLHPDGTISPEMGLCLNPYVSRLGMGLLSARDPTAGALVAAFEERAVGRGGLAPYLADDLRLTRWSHLPLVTALLADGFHRVAAGRGALAAAFPPGWTYAAAANVCAYHGQGTHVYFSPAGGGAVRVFHHASLVAEDLGVIVQGNPPLVPGGYDPSRAVTMSGTSAQARVPLAPASFFRPTFLERLALRAASSTAIGSRVARAVIDAIRMKRRTAVNQSATPLARRSSSITLDRTLHVTDGRVRIVDRLESRRPIDPQSVRSFFTVHGEQGTVVESRSLNQRLELLKTIEAPAASPMLARAAEGGVAGGA